MNRAVQQLAEMVTTPPEGAAFEQWIELTDAPALLRADLELDHFVLYASVGDVFMHAVLVPSTELTTPDFEDLMGWNSNPYSSWGMCYSFDPPRVWVEPPLNGCGSKSLARGEQLVFVRSFDGYTHKRGYVELLQKLAHLFALHYMEERKAYCRLDKHGDVEDVVSIIDVEDPSGHLRGGTVVTISRAVLDEYMAVTDTSVVRMFDITRFMPGRFGGWSGPVTSEETSNGDLRYRYHVEAGHASYMRGVQLVASGMSREEAAKHYRWGDDPNRQYASFIAYDWKNGLVREVSCAPGQTANYFTKSDAPFEISPAFFRPEVLLKYKADSDKYRLQDRSISCRGAWHLETYDINEAGQVHTYIVYLRDLPYEEQLYWKAFNEAPKAPISERAFRSDFEGRFHDEYDPAQSLRQMIDELNKSQVPWWVSRSEKLCGRVHYPATDSADEWLSEILNLDQVVVEGFKGKWLRQRAQALGRTPPVEFGSLKLVEECLIALGYEEEQARQVTAPLHHLHYYRSKLKAHGSGGDAVLIRQGVLQDHGTYRKHFRTLCAECDEAIRNINEAFKRFR